MKRTTDNSGHTPESSNSRNFSPNDASRISLTDISNLPASKRQMLKPPYPHPPHPRPHLPPPPAKTGFRRPPIQEDTKSVAYLQKAALLNQVNVLKSQLAAAEQKTTTMELRLREAQSHDKSTQIAELQEQLTQLTNENSQLHQKIEDLESGITIRDASLQKLDETESQLNHYKLVEEQLQAEIDKLKAESQDLVFKLEHSDKAVVECGLELEGLKSRLQAAEADKQTNEEQLQTLVEQVGIQSAADEKKYRKLNDQISELIARTEDREFKISDLEDQIIGLQQTCKSQIEEIRTLQDDLEFFQHGIAQTNELVEELETKNDTLMQNSINLESQQEQNQAFIESLKDQIEDKQEIIRENNADLEELETKLQELQSALEEQSTSKSQLNLELDECKHKLQVQTEQKLEFESKMQELQDELHHLKDEKLKSNETSEDEVQNLVANYETQLQQGKTQYSELEVMYNESKELVFLTGEKFNEASTRAKEAEEKLAELNEQQVQMTGQLDKLQIDNTKLETELQNMSAAFFELQQIYDSKQETNCQNQLELEQKLIESVNLIEEYKAVILQKSNEVSELQVQMEHQNVSDNVANGRTEEDFRLMEAKFLETERMVYRERKTILHLRDYIQSIQGNIRLVARVRPLKSPVALEEKPQHLQLSQTHVKIVERETKVGGGIREKIYAVPFDRVFGPDDTMRDIHAETEDVISSVLYGRNACIFAYGQTGSGKTWTVGGQNGITSFALQNIMLGVNSEGEYMNNGFKYHSRITAVEIYNEQIIDLLQSESEVPVSDKTAIIQLDSKTNQPQLCNVTTIPVETYDQGMEVFQIATNARSTASTNANERSSRSHFVFTIKVIRTNLKTNEVTVNSLNLVDLAGSERLAQAQTTGDRLKETKAINTSLSSLGNVINALVNKRASSYVPFRSSKLTFMLQGSLSGTARVMMLIALSPEIESLEETKSTLRFAEKASKASIL